jgi:hypothetical protein
MEIRQPKTIKDLIVRWENVERVLDSLPMHERRKHFSMEMWGQKTECGTVACAAGHCGLDPWFRRRGLQLNFNYRGEATGRNGDDFGYDMELFFHPPWENMNSDFRWMAQQGTEIFYGLERPVSTVLRQVRAYLKRLRKAAE